MPSEHVPAAAAAAALGVCDYLCVCSRVCECGCESVRASVHPLGASGRTRLGRRE